MSSIFYLLVVNVQRSTHAFHPPLAPPFQEGVQFDAEVPFPSGGARGRFLLMIQSTRINHRLSSIITTQNHKQIAYHSSLLVIVKLYNTLGRQLVERHLNH